MTKKKGLQLHILKLIVGSDRNRVNADRGTVAALEDPAVIHAFDQRRADARIESPTAAAERVLA